MEFMLGMQLGGGMPLLLLAAVLELLWVLVEVELPPPAPMQLVPAGKLAQSLAPLVHPTA
jgi:hypothetical protein